ncbi:MAG: acryloyl-CoA reductase [Firmicutes bacterium]|nr:acryloyl-CoA reductase [Bacillota bacterium]
MKPEGRSSFRAFWVERTGERFFAGVRELPAEALPEADVTVRVEYSSLNYKDALATRPDGRVVRRYPMVAGIDLAGRVVDSRDPRFRPGEEVLATGYELGVAHFGGLAEYARLPGDWLLPIPEGWGPREAMTLGTAGLTAGLAVERLEQLGLGPGDGPVLVTGASGGVGSLAVALLAARGYRVAASTGKAEADAYLRQLGAEEVLERAATSASSSKALESQRWAAAVDPVGGETTAYLLRTLRYGGALALVGLAGGAELRTSVHPFILRGVTLAGIDSAYAPVELRRRVWRRLAAELPAVVLERVRAAEVGLEGVAEAAASLLRGEVRGRVLVRL